MAEARDWRVHTDPATGEVDEQALNKALLQCGVLLCKLGGSVVMLAHRKAVPNHPDELPSERLTTVVDIRWATRTDTRPQFEDVPRLEVDADAEPEEPAADDEPAAELELAESVAE